MRRRIRKVSPRFPKSIFVLPTTFVLIHLKQEDMFISNDFNSSCTNLILNLDPDLFSDSNSKLYFYKVIIFNIFLFIEFSFRKINLASLIS